MIYKDLKTIFCTSKHWKSPMDYTQS